MTFFLGNYGNVRLRRGTDDQLGQITSNVAIDDVNTILNRVGIDAAVDNLFTGDRVDIETTDSRGLAFIPGANWSSGSVEDTFSAFVHVNAAGGLRLFNSFTAAVNNERSNEVALQTFTGDPIPVTVKVRDVSYNLLGNVTGYEFNTSRDSIDITALQDKFKQQYNAGLLSGSGRIECAFDYETAGIKETPLLMLQIIQRLDLGSAFDVALYLTDKEVDPDVENIFYQTTAVVTNTGISIEAQNYISCTVDFVTTGEIKLVIGKPSDYILKEDDDRIRVEQGLDYLLQEVTD